MDPAVVGLVTGFLLVGAMLLFAAIARGRIKMGAEKFLHVEMTEERDRFGRGLAAVIGVALVGVAIFLVVTADDDDDDDASTTAEPTATEDAKTPVTEDKTATTQSATPTPESESSPGEEGPTPTEDSGQEAPAAPDPSAPAVPVTLSFREQATGTLESAVEMYEFEVVDPGPGQVEVSTFGQGSASLELVGPGGQTLGNLRGPDSFQVIKQLFVSGQYQVYVGPLGDDVSRPYRVSVSMDPASDVAFGEPAEGNLFEAADVDTLRFEGGHTSYRIDTYEGELPASVDLRLLGPRGHTLAVGAPPVNRILEDDGVHFVEVSSREGWTGTYTLWVDRASPSPPPPGTVPPGTVPPGTDPTPLPTTAPPGLPESMHGRDGAEAGKILLAFGFLPRFLDVCSDSVAEGQVHRILLEETAEDGSVLTVVVDDESGLTDEGAALEVGSELAVEISSGNPCG